MGAESRQSQPQAVPGPGHFAAAAEFVLMLRSAGLSDTALLRAMEQVPRVPFLDPAFFPHADDDAEFPIPCGQTIDRPATIGRMIEALSIGSSDRVLEVGTGTGYSAAIMGRLAGEVVSVERWRRLADEAHMRLRGLGYDMVEVVFGDGLAGFAPRAPYDRILIGCSIEAIPDRLLNQLKPGGLLVAPIGPPRREQDVVLVRKGAAGAEPTMIGRARFRAAVPEVARRG
jgi:protein-L-isoaspartate(D-aspartate) O-methyltransferase